VVCPQGVLFRGQPAVEEETGETSADGTPKVRRRKPDDEYVIRKGVLDARFVDAVIALPLNVFYGAGVPACLLIFRKDRPADRRDKVLLIYAARHYRELSNKNQLRPQDVMRILVHYHAYGDPEKAKEQVALHSARLRQAIDEQEADEIGRITTEYEKTKAEVAKLESGGTNGSKAEQNRRLKALEKLRKKLAERDERIAEARKQMAEDRQAIEAVGAELEAMYANPAELARHARVVDFAEIVENEYNLNIPRYVDTFEPEEPIDVAATLKQLAEVERQRVEAEQRLRGLLAGTGLGEKLNP
jgi:type I restriction enzyme M protein